MAGCGGSCPPRSRPGRITETLRTTEGGHTDTDRPGSVSAGRESLPELPGLPRPALPVRRHLFDSKLKYTLRAGKLLGAAAAEFHTRAQQL